MRKKMPQTTSISRNETIREDLHSKIISGEITGKLPTIHELAQQYEVNFKTVQKAIRQLEKQLVVVCQRGAGIYVHPRLHGNHITAFYMVYPGNMCLQPHANLYHDFVAGLIDQMMVISNQKHLEPRMLAVTPVDPNGPVNESLLERIPAGGTAVFIGIRQYADAILGLAKRGVQCIVINAGWNVEYLKPFADLPVSFVGSDYSDLPSVINDFASYHQIQKLGILSPVNLLEVDGYSYIFGPVAEACPDVSLSFANGKYKKREDSYFESLQQLLPGYLVDLLDQSLAQDAHPDALMVMSYREARALRQILKIRDRKLAHLPILCMDWDHQWSPNQEQIDGVCHTGETFMAKTLARIENPALFVPGERALSALGLFVSDRHSSRVSRMKPSEVHYHGSPV